MKHRNAEDYFNVHKDQPALILGNGPSLNEIKGYEEYILNNFVTIGMNRSWRILQTKYHAIMFHYEHLDELKRGLWKPEPNSVLWAFKDYCEMWLREVDQGSVIYVPSVADPQDDMHQFNFGGLISSDLSENSYADMTGHFALEVALWMRCKPIYLIGFDLYGGHFDDKLRPDDAGREMQIDLFDYTAEHIKTDFKWAEVYNLSEKSAITGFEKKALSEVLSEVLNV